MAEVEELPVLIDEHGDPVGVPKYVTPETLERWLICAIIATNATGTPDGHPENQMFAKHLFDSPIETGDYEAVDDAEQTELTEGLFDRLSQARSAAARMWTEAWVRRNREGEFMDKPDPPKPMSLRRPQLPPQSPGVQFTEGDIRAAGLDKWPEKGERAREILGDSPNTAALHVVGEPASAGTVQRVPYSSERTTLHDEIIAAFLKDKTPPSDRPTAVFMAGGPSSGKTSTLDANRDELLPTWENTVEIDPDKIKEMLPEYQELRAAKDRYAATAVHLESGDIAAKLMLEAREQGFHLLIDGTGDSDPGQFSGHLSDARAQGYDVDVIYVTAPTDQAISWSINRAAETGRFVPVDVIREQHRAVSRNFMDEVVGLDWLDKLDVFDRGDHIATWESGRLIIMDREKFKAFIEKRNEVRSDG